MPYLELNTIKGMLSSQQKQQLMDGFTDLLVKVEGGGAMAASRGAQKREG